jgi:hypothetical protein
MLCRESDQDPTSISPQDVYRRTLERNVAPESSGFGVWPSNDEDLSTLRPHGFDRKLLTARRTEAVEGDSEGVPSDCFGSCQQVWVPVLDPCMS